MKSSGVVKIVGFHSGKDVAYAILENGVPVVHEELERISRKKMELADGLTFFFSRCEKYDDVKYFTFGNPGGREGKYEEIYGDKKSDAKMYKTIEKNHGQFLEIGHHRSHAANAFFTSSFDKSLIITVDGGGYEDKCFLTALTISEGINNTINMIKAYPRNEINLGRIYNQSTRLIFNLSTGFPRGSQAGTVMAMSTFGKAKYYEMFSDFGNNWRELKRIASLSEQDKFDVAASLQQWTEQAFRKHIEKYINESNNTNICFSGGVSLNCVMLGKMKTWFPKIKNMFCDPVPYDAGVALGSARYLWHHVLHNPRIKNNFQNMSPYLGITYTKKDVDNACSLYQGKIKLERATDEEVLNRISKQKIIAVFGDKSESGRRALGNRSILADPRNATMKDLINQKVKHREWFRPLSPSILEEKVGEWFEDPVSSPYMSFALKFKSDMRAKAPAVVHFDGTGRLQTVNKILSPWYHSFIQKWESLSGVPILINTSFNDREPIVETPEDALECFLGTDIDNLYFFDYGILVTKS